MAVNSFEWGKEFEHFFDVTERLKSDINFTEPVYLSLPCFFSGTRFANHCAKVYQSLRKDYPGLIITLEETQLSNAGGDSKAREKANTAAQIKASLLNKKFALRLSGLCDLYAVFGHAVNILQKVNILPHEKYDLFIKCISDYTLMAESISNHDKCPQLPKPVCQWPNYHKDIADINNGKYRGIPIIDNNQEARRATITRFLANKNASENNDSENIIKTVEKQLIALLKELSEKLKSNVYDEQDLKVLQKVRFLTDLKGLFDRVKARGVVMTSSLEGDTFVKYAKSICHTITDIPNDSLKLQHKLFLKQLYELYQNMTQDELDKLSSMKIIQTFLNSNLNLFVNIELVMHVICGASVIMSVESVVESIVSQYENRQSKFRNLSELRANNEMMIAVNGPNLAHSDSLLEKALNTYFKHHKNGKWHFTMDQSKVSYSISKIVDSKKSKSSKLSFIDA